MSSIREAIRQIAQRPGAEDSFLVGTVLAVREAEIDVRPSDGSADVLGVRIQAKEASTGVKLRCTEGADVLIGMVNDTLGVLLVASDVDALELLADEVILGGDGEKAVLGETLNERLSDIIGVQEQAVQALQTFAATQVAASVGPLAGYAPGFTALGTSMAQVLLDLAALKLQLDNHLSAKVKLQ